MLRERMIRCLHHEVTTVVPWSIKFTVEALERYQRARGGDFDPIRDTGSHVVTSHTNSDWTEVRPGHWRDHFGVVWNKTRDRTLGVVDDPPLRDARWGDYRLPDPAACPVLGRCLADRKRYPDHFHMLSIGFALFERAWSLVGMEELLCLMAEEDPFVDELLERINAWNLGILELAAGSGIDCLHIGDDWGSQHGPLIGPDTWRRFIAPHLAALCAAAHRHGLLLSLHCCGNVEPLMEDICAAGVDVFDPFQPEAMDIWDLRARFRGRMAFWGGLSVQQTMPFGSPDTVRQETRRLLEVMAPGGGYILAPAHSLSGDVPPENIDAFLAVARRAGKG